MIFLEFVLSKNNTNHKITNDKYDFPITGFIEIK